jgi:stress response protein YsnF
MKKKHWPITISVLLPGIEDPLKLEVETTMKIKQLKQIIKEKSGMEVPLDKIQLQVEGGSILKKATVSLDEAEIKEGSSINVEVIEKINTSAAKEKKASKE